MATAQVVPGNEKRISKLNYFSISGEACQVVPEPLTNISHV